MMSDIATDGATAPTVAPTEPKVLLQITKDSNFLSSNKKPSYSVNVLSYYDGTNLQNNTDESDVEKLLTDPKNNILLIENNKGPVKVEMISSISPHLFRKFKPEQITQPEKTIQNDDPSFKNKLLGIIGQKSAKVAVTSSGGKRKTKRKRTSYKKSSYKKSSRRNLTRRS